MERRLIKNKCNDVSWEGCKKGLRQGDPRNIRPLLEKVNLEKRAEFIV
jgi:hypothetical protein